MIERKNALRREIRTQQEALTEEELAVSDEAICVRILESGIYERARRLFLYYSCGREVDTRRLLRRAQMDGKIVALPVTEAGRRMTFYRYHGILCPGRFGIPEPDKKEQLSPEPEDVVVVPALSFDRLGYRLGRGGGYYDTFLPDCPAKCIGLCREAFFREELPRAWNDFPVNAVITETGVHFVR